LPPQFDQNIRIAADRAPIQISPMNFSLRRAIQLDHIRQAETKSRMTRPQVNWPPATFKMNDFGGGGIA
jgi:hypothetical protein